jgi:large subunit ribosomal protein L15
MMMFKHIQRSVQQANMMMPMQFRTLVTNKLQLQQEVSGELLPFTINNIWDNPGARRMRKRVGRGPGSGVG